MQVNLNFDLHPRQADALNIQVTELLYGGAAGGGKLLRLNELVPTNKGYKKVSEIRVGDVLYDEKGKPCNVLGLSAIEKEPVSYELTFDNGVKIKACKDHQWLTYTSKELAQLTRRTPEFRERRKLGREKRGKGLRPDLVIANQNKKHNYLNIPEGSAKTTEEIYNTLRTARGRTNHAIPVCEAVEYQHKDYKLDPYCLGAWLGDGDSDSGSITGIDSEVWESFESQGFEVRHRKEAKRHRIIGLLPILKELGVYKNKHIPEEYLFGSIEQRIALLQGLLDTDGTCDKDGAIQFTNTNKNLSDGVYELVCSLGIKAHRTEKIPKLYGKACKKAYLVKFITEKPVFRIKRKLARQKKKISSRTRFHYIVDCKPSTPEPMRCIEVDSPRKLFLVTNSYIPTHNSHLSRVLAILWCLEIEGLQVYFFRRLYDDLKKNHIEGPTGFVAMLAPWINTKHPDSKLTGGRLVEIVDGEIRFWNGSKIFLCHLQHQKDLTKYYGPEFHVLFLEEATQFTEYMIRFLRSRLRMPEVIRKKIPAKYLKPKEEWKDKNVPDYYFPRAIYTSNPGGVGHAYIKRAFLTGFKPYEIHRGPADDGGHLRAYIPAKVDDNPAVNREEYKANLAGLPPALVKALLEGNWNAVIGAYFPEINPAVHIVPPFQIPDWWVRFMSMDWGACGDGDPFAIGWWAVSDGSIPMFPRNSLICYRTWYGRGLPKITARQVSEGIRLREGNEQIVYRVAGGDILEKRGHGESIFEIFQNTGIYFQRADMRRVSGWQQIRERLLGFSEIPCIYWFQQCEDALDTMVNLQHDPNNPNDCKGDDHFADMVRYACMSRPYERDKPAENKTLDELFTKPTIDELWELRNINER